MEYILMTAVGLLTVLVLGILLFAARNFRRVSQIDEAGRMTYPQGFGVSSGISIGAGFGVALGVAIGHLALGIPIGAAIGAVLGGIWERGNRIRPISRQERRWFKWLSASGILVLAVGAACFLLIR